VAVFKARKRGMTARLFSHNTNVLPGRKLLALRKPGFLKVDFRLSPEKRGTAVFPAGQVLRRVPAHPGEPTAAPEPLPARAPL